MIELANETDIIWLEDPSGLPYVRVVWLPATRRRQRPPQSALGRLRLVGYAAVARCRRELRRAFVLEPHDPGGNGEVFGGYLEGGAPAESRVPSTLAPGVDGVHPYAFPGFMDLIVASKERGELSVSAAPDRR